MSLVEVSLSYLSFANGWDRGAVGVRDSDLMIIGEKAYCDATNFRPERWYEKPEMVKEPTAFAPFSTGKSDSQRKSTTHRTR